MKILAVDLGETRTGIAISDFNEKLASPVCVIEERNRERLLTKIANIVEENHVSEIVVGLPKNMDGSEGESAKKAREFQGLLKDKTKLTVVMIDERGTTITAHNYLNFTDTRGKKRKRIIDSVAATIILQNYLDSKKQ
ncbi:MAG: putative pre-16S rRNA nuclease [Eubacteriales bacterium SKADARSKE-1]|nr:putative pre-16S rRNA nuclease [Eubacteriales bacterium SKADARSKE-1]